MRRIMITLGTFMLFSMLSFSQTEDNVETWRDSHPSVLIITQDIYDGFDDSQRALLKDFIIIEDELTLADIELYESVKKSLALYEDNIEHSKNDADFIKIWISEHPDVKILKQSYYQNLSIDEQSQYQDLGHLILEGELITKQDLINYNNTH